MYCHFVGIGGDINDIRLGIVPARLVGRDYACWHGIYIIVENDYMPWYNGDYPPSYKNQPEELRKKATEIANEVLLNGASEGVAIATGLKRAREILRDENQPRKKRARRDKD
jgi:hypothetical protein